MSQQNVDIVRRGFEAFSRGDLDAVLADLSPEYSFEPSGRFVDTQRAYRGPEGFAEFFHAFRAAWNDFEIRIEHMDDLGDRVLTLGYFHGHGSGSGVEINAEAAWLHTLEDGFVVHLRSFITWEEAREAVGDRGT